MQEISSVNLPVGAPGLSCFSQNWVLVSRVRADPPMRSIVFEYERISPPKLATGSADSRTLYDYAASRHE